MRTELGQHLYAMACNNAWANHRLLGAVASLPRDEVTAARPSFFGSILATLNHIVTVDWLYVDAVERALRGEPPHPDPGAFFTPEHPFDAVEPLREAQRAVDRRLIDACDDLDTKAVVRIRRRWGTQQEAMPRLLAHLFQHQIHHRGQVHDMLSATPVAPPQLDEFFSAAEAPLRARELAELGLSEEEIWG